jgi:hypothetical protein
MYKKFGLCIAFLLMGCTTETHPEEDFEGPTGQFPLLGTVPDRPALPSSDELTNQEKQLKYERDQATEKQLTVLKSIKP